MVVNDDGDGVTGAVWVVNDDGACNDVTGAGSRLLRATG